MRTISSSIALKYRISALDDYLIGQSPASRIWPVRVCLIGHLLRGGPPREVQTNGVQKTARSSNARMSSLAIPVRGARTDETDGGVGEKVCCRSAIQMQPVPRKDSAIRRRSG